MKSDFFAEMRYFMNNLSCIPSLTQLPDYTAFSRQYHAAFEYNDFFLPAVLDQEDEKKRIMSLYMNLDRDRSQDTMHGAFLDICINSDDPQIFAVSDKRVHQSMEIAKTMHLKAVIFHTNYIVNFRLRPYLDHWLDKNELYWRNLLKEYPNQSVYLENMFDDTPNLLTTLARRMKDEPRFSVCLDTAHAFISGSPLDDWFQSLTPYVSHLHINDNNGLEDLHQPVGTGIFPWEKLCAWIPTLDKKPSLLIEVRSFEDLQTSVAYMQKKKIYPFTE
jgi:sugar phosphate isomerase/epimerase